LLHEAHETNARDSDLNERWHRLEAELEVVRPIIEYRLKKWASEKKEKGIV
jgi:hypothetical protein